MPGARIWRRLTAEWKIKLFLGGAITALFWSGYFRLEQGSRGSMTLMPALAIDRMIPFTPEAAIIYISQLVTMPAVIWMMISRRQLLYCCRGLLLLIGVSFVIYYFRPTMIVRPEVIAGRYYIYDLIVGTDQNSNACPSLHAAFGIFTAGCAWDVFNGWETRRWLTGVTWAWAAAVLVSTLLIKQHVILDLLAGGVLGMVSWWFAGRLPNPIAAPGNADPTP